MLARGRSSRARSASRLAYAQGKGVLFFTGHFGFWELQAIVHALQLDRSASWRAPLDNPQLNQLLEASARPTGNTVIYRRGDDPPRHARARRPDTAWPS